MIVAVIHQGDALTGIDGSIAKGKLSRTNGISLYADTKYLALYAGLDLIKVKRLREDLVNGFLIANTGAHTVSRNVLKAITGPNVHNTRLTQLLCQVSGDADTSLAVFDPEFADLRIRRAQCQASSLGMRKESRVKVTTQASLFTKIYPLGKVLWL
jgi:hypothetical protein